MKKQIVTINVPDAYITAFESLIRLGLYNSRSEIVREALKEFLENEKELNEDLQVENFIKIKSGQSTQHSDF